MSSEDEFAEAQSVRSGAKSRVVTVGWTLRTAKAHTMWQAPQSYRRTDAKAKSAKSVQY